MDGNYKNSINTAGNYDNNINTAGNFENSINSDIPATEFLPFSQRSSCPLRRVDTVMFHHELKPYH